MKASEFDALFDAGESTVEYLDKTKMKRPGLEQRRITVDFPAWMVHQLDKEAIRLGITRQSIIKMWISEKISTKTA
ncbi:MAG TPA: hypothetical protein VHI78_05325 [Bacteroidales bacterium]|jgi:hypothetical protein|nr:hypothetical protein [Bacteroidales bacterium]